MTPPEFDKLDRAILRRLQAQGHRRGERIEKAQCAEHPEVRGSGHAGITRLNALEGCWRHTGPASQFRRRDALHPALIAHTATPTLQPFGNKNGGNGGGNEFSGRRKSIKVD